VSSDAEQSTWIRSALERYERPLVLYAARVVGDAELARDVVQETFLKLWDQDRAELAARLGPWLFTTCRNRALDVKQKEGRMQPLANDEAGTLRAERRTERPAHGTEDPASTTEARDARSHVLRTIDSLPENQREVIRLKFQSDFSYREIAAITGLSVGNVGFLLHVGLKALRERLSPLQPKEAR